MIKEKYSCFVYGEGGKDRAFLQKLIFQDKFQYHTKKWTFQFDNAAGNSPKDVLEKCKRASSTHSYDLVLCFIDLDKLKHDYPRGWKKEKSELENKYKNINIIWQIDNAEDEYKKALSKIGKSCNKNELNKLARKEVRKFINSEFWHRILYPIRRKEKELDKQRKLLAHS